MYSTLTSCEKFLSKRVSIGIQTRGQQTDILCDARPRPLFVLVAGSARLLVAVILNISHYYSLRR